MVPAGMIELDEPDVALGQAAGQQAVGREGPRLAGVGAVEVEDVVGLLREVGHFRDRGLHPVGHLVLGDPGVDRRVERWSSYSIWWSSRRRSSILRRPAAEIPAGLSR